MPTQPRRWPTEAETERETALRAATEAIQHLQTAQETLDSARAKLHANQGLSSVLLADSDRFVADAATRLERVKRAMLLARARPVSGRWPQVATKQRDDIEHLTGEGIALLADAQDQIGRARSKVPSNPILAEAMVADVATVQAKAINRVERIASLLIEAGIGRD